MLLHRHFFADNIISFVWGELLLTHIEGTEEVVDCRVRLAVGWPASFEVGRWPHPRSPPSKREAVCTGAKGAGSY